MVRKSGNKINFALHKQQWFNHQVLMNSLFHRSITILMASLILLSSTGFGVIEHVCLVKGKSLQMVKEAASSKMGSSCCAKSKLKVSEDKTYFKKTDCCKENPKYEKVEVVSSHNQLLSKYLKVLADGVIWSVQSFLFLQAEWKLPSFDTSSSDYSFTSLFYGRSMLNFVQSYLIWDSDC